MFSVFSKNSKEEGVRERESVEEEGKTGEEEKAKERLGKTRRGEVESGVDKEWESVEREEIGQRGEENKIGEMGKER